MAWIRDQRTIDAVIWTGLPSNWPKMRGREFTHADAVAYVSELETAKDDAKTRLDRAREYVANAPPIIDTEVRRQLRARGWIDAQLAATLFQQSPEMGEEKGTSNEAPSAPEGQQ